jgi:hypothetical protein
MLYHIFYFTFSCYLPLTKPGLRYLYSCSYTGLDCETRVEAASNTSTVTLLVVGGDEKGSLKSETVKKDCAGKGKQHTI